MSVPLASTLQVKFNQPMDRQSVEASFSLHPFDTPAQKVAGKFTWADDGAGFDTSASFPGHLGLRSMRERMARLGGDLTITSTPGQGATIRATLSIPG